MTNPAAAGSISQRVAAWSSSLAFDAIPGEVVRVAKRCIVDTVGVGLAGANSDLARNLLSFATESYAAGPCTAFGSTRDISAVGAALVNGTCSHAYDFDDTSYTGIMHGSAVVLPAALAAAQTAGGGGRGLLAAFVAGVEADYALALVCTTHHYFKGWWSSGTFGAFGAVTAACRALDLDQRRTTQAMGLAMTQACGLKAGFGTDGKPYLAGRSAAGGTEAAFLVAAGLDGPEQVFEDPRGFLALMNDGLSDLGALDGLGRSWRLRDPGVFFKRFPVCSAAHAAAEVTETLMRDHGLGPGDIVTIHCKVPPVVAVSLVYDRPTTPREAQFSLPFVLGCQLVHGDLGLEHLTPAVLGDPALQAAMARVDMEVCDEPADRPEAAEGTPEWAALRITCADGRVLEGLSALPKGMPANPLSDDELSHKFLRCVRFAGLADANAEDLLDRLWHLEQTEDLCGLFDDATPTARA